MIKQLTIIGLGLIGGSIARAIKPTGFCQKIVAYDKNSEVLNHVKHANLVDSVAHTIESAINDADLILLAVPPSEFAVVLYDLAKNISQRTVITDVSSVKSSLIHVANNILGEYKNQFVPGHPIAGSEKSGLIAAEKDLFENRVVILTPTLETNPAAIEMVKIFWENLNAHVKFLSPEDHDSFLAATSHLPQILAYTLMDQIVNEKSYPEVLEFTGAGFRDVTRIAASDPKLWTDICIQNRNPLLVELDQIRRRLHSLQSALENQDDQYLLEIFSRAKQARDHYNTLAEVSEKIED